MESFFREMLVPCQIYTYRGWPLPNKVSREGEHWTILGFRSPGYNFLREPSAVERAVVCASARTEKEEDKEIEKKKRQRKEEDKAQNQEAETRNPMKRTGDQEYKKRKEKRKKRKKMLPQLTNSCL